MKRHSNALVLAFVAALMLAGCGSDNGSGDSSSGGGENFNDADVTFAQSMIPHHQQAVEMAKMAKMRASSSDVKQFADKIEAAQGPQINTMTGWLEEWGEDVEPESSNGMDHDMDSMGSDDMPSMMSEDDMKRLNGSSDAGFDKMFLTMMIEHHTGAIDMAKTELSEGENPDALALAEKIEAEQTAEIAHMKNLLKS